MRDFFGHGFKTQALDLCVSLFCLCSLILSPVLQLNYSPGNILGHQGCTLKAQFGEFSCSGFHDFSLTSLLVYERCETKLDVRKQGLTLCTVLNLIQHWKTWLCLCAIHGYYLGLSFYLLLFVVFIQIFFYLYKQKSIFLLTINIIWFYPWFFIALHGSHVQLKVHF